MTTSSVTATPATPPRATWLYEPFPASDFSLRDLRDEERSLSALKGSPVALVAWASEAGPSREALLALDRAHSTLSDAGIRSLALAFDGPENIAAVRAAAKGVSSIPVVVASKEVALAWAILHRHLFIGRPDLQLPTVFLLDGQGPDRAYLPGRRRARTRSCGTRRRSTPLPGGASRARTTASEERSVSMPAPPDIVPYGRDLLDQGHVVAGPGGVRARGPGTPRASVLFRLGSLLAKKGESVKARSAYERALSLQPDPAEASNDLGTLLAQAGDVPGAIERFRAALAATPDYPDALNNLGYALLLTGNETEARQLYERALALQPDLPEALNNLGLIRGRHGDMDAAAALFRRALDTRPGYGEAAGNLALVMTYAWQYRGGDPAAARVHRGEPRLREHVRHAREDLPGVEPS